MRETMRIGRLPALALTVFLLMVMAASTSGSVDARLKQDIAAIDDAAAVSHQTQIVADRVAKEFNVPVDNVFDLRRRVPGMGQVTAVYVFADKMPGGIIPDNVNKVVSERQSGKDWDEIASVLGIRLKSVSTEVHVVYKAVHKDIEQASTGKATKGAGAGGRTADQERPTEEE